MMPFPHWLQAGWLTLSHLMQTEWGRWSLVEASRLLLAAALQETLNQRFVLVSESCIPLYPPTTVWQQLLSEDRSRIDACKLDGVSASCNIKRSR